MYLKKKTTAIESLYVSNRYNNYYVQDMSLCIKSGQRIQGNLSKVTIVYFSHDQGSQVVTVQ